MDTHPHPDRLTTRPVERGQVTLRLCRSSHRIRRGPEHNEEAVPLRPHLRTTMGGPRLTQHRALGIQRIRIRGIPTG
jgi:hypothetical protein